MRVLGFASVLIIVAGAAVADEKSYDFNHFEKISARQGVTVNIVTGADFSVQAEALRGKLRNLKIRENGGELTIGRKAGWRWGLWNALRDDKYVVTIMMPMLADLDVSSGASVTAKGDGYGDLSVEASSGSFASVAGLLGGDVELDASSGASLRISGDCGELTAQASSGSTIDAADLRCQTADLDGSSGASIRASASEVASIEGSSGAGLRLSGGAVIEQQDLSSGASLRAN